MQVYLPIAEMSVNGLVILALGGIVGFLSGLFGVGGGFLMTPLLIFVGIPAAVAVVTILQAITNHTVDAMLALLLLVGGVIGAQFGTRFGTNLRGEQMRALLALMVVSVCIKLAVDLVLTPDDVYSTIIPGVS
jgi:uncharacterized membrane protein YfcA